MNSTNFDFLICIVRVRYLYLINFKYRFAQMLVPITCCCSVELYGLDSIRSRKKRAYAEL